MHIFTQQNAAITGGSCMEGGNRRRRIQPKAEEPTDQVDIKQQIGTAVQLATEVAKQSGASEVTVDVGGIKITIKKDEKANPHAPIAQLDEPAPQLQVRPEIQSFLDEVKTGTIKDVKHCTRSIEPVQSFKPEAPRAFQAGEFQMTYETSDGEAKAFKVQTESVVGHLGNVTPGQTRVGGYVSLMSDPDNSRSETVQLTRDEQEALLKTLYDKAGQKMTEKACQNTQFAIDTVAAVRFQNEGASAVAAAHQRYA